MTDSEAPFPRRTSDPVDVLDSPVAGDLVIRGSLLRVGGYMAGVLLGLIAASLLTRHLGVGTFGKYIVVTSLIAIVSGLTDAGIATIAAREFATRRGEDRDRLLANVLGIRAAIAAVGVLAATGFAIVAGYDTVMVVGTLVAGIGLVLTTAQQTARCSAGRQPAAPGGSLGSTSSARRRGWRLSSSSSSRTPGCSLFPRRRFRWESSRSSWSARSSGRRCRSCRASTAKSGGASSA